MSTSMTETTDLDVLREQAEQGRKAAETLAEHERARQAERTEALAALQDQYDADVCRRGPEVDAALEAQRDEATAALVAAVDAADLSAALRAWRAEASARFAQRAVRQGWRQAHARSGEGPMPPRESQREAERDEGLAFLPAVAQAAESGARLDGEGMAADLLGDRPVPRAGEVLPGVESSLRHSDGCADRTRVEVTHPSAGRSSHGVVVRCQSCGASLLVTPAPPEPEDVEAAAPGPDLLRRPEAGDYPPAP